MANPRFNKQVAQPRGMKVGGRVKKMGGGRRCCPLQLSRIYDVIYHLFLWFCVYMTVHSSISDNMCCILLSPDPHNNLVSASAR